MSKCSQTATPRCIFETENFTWRVAPTECPAELEPRRVEIWFILVRFRVYRWSGMLAKCQKVAWSGPRRIWTLREKIRKNSSGHLAVRHSEIGHLGAARSRNRKCAPKQGREASRCVLYSFLNGDFNCLANYDETDPQITVKSEN